MSDIRELEEHDVSAVVTITVAGSRGQNCGNGCRFMHDARKEIKGAHGVVLYGAQLARCSLGPDVVLLTRDKRRNAYGYNRTRYCRENEQ